MNDNHSKSDIIYKTGRQNKSKHSIAMVNDTAKRGYCIPLRRTLMLLKDKVLMMKKIIIFLLICLMVACIGCSKTKTVKAKTFDGWTTVKMNNEIEFQIPPTMETQNEKYKTINKQAMSGVYELLPIPDSNRVIAQQLGLNALGKGALKHYVRAIMEIKDSPEELPAFGDTLKFSKEELDDITKDFTQEFYTWSEKFKAADRLHRSYLLVGVTSPCKVINVNGVDCLFYAYDTQLADYPFVENYIYLFLNKKKIYKLSIMIRTTEHQLWTSTGRNVLDIVQTVQPIVKNK